MAWSTLGALIMPRHKTRSRSERPPLKPHHLLFPSATLFALAAVPLWLLFRLKHSVASAWHGHEMLFGFALAVVAGFLSTRAVGGVVWILLGTWLAGRIAAGTGSSPLALLIGMTFPAMVLMVAVPPLLSGAKRWENRILPAILAALVAADAAWWAGAVWLSPPVQTRALLTAIDLFALLLLLIGDRSLRAAVGGHLERLGVARRDHTQRRYELPLVGLVGGAAVFDAFTFGAVAGLLCIGAAFLTLLRVMPWQLHRTLSHPPLWTLGLGYLWLLPGLAAKGIAQLGDTVPVTDMLHGLGVGALGTLTLVMMARTATLRARKPIADFADIGIATLLVSAAALSRLLAPYLSAAQHWLLWLAATAWTGAFVILLIRLRRSAGPAPPRARHTQQLSEKP